MQFQCRRDVINDMKLRIRGRRSRDGALDTPRSYLIGSDDIALPPGEWGWHPRMSSRLGLYRLVQMPGSHELIFSNPTGLADKIIEAGRD